MNVYLYEVEIDKQFEYPDVVTKLVVVEINGLLILSEYQLACASTIHICYWGSSSYEELVLFIWEDCVILGDHNNVHTPTIGGVPSRKDMLTPHFVQGILSSIWIGKKTAIWSGKKWGDN